MKLKVYQYRDKYFHLPFLLAVFFVLTIGMSLRRNTVYQDELFFAGSYDEALERSEEMGKPLFIFGYTDWSGYCIKFQNHTLSDSLVRQYLTDNFISLRVNMDSDDGARIARRYLVEGHPALLFVHHDGSEILQVTGYKNIHEFLTTLEKVNKPDTSGKAARH